jgi:hypothetical protein
VLLTVWLSAASGPVAAQEQDVPLLLAHRFTIAEPPSWSDVAVHLAPGQWRVGGPDGPVASAWQLRSALARLIAVEVAGCCSGWADGSTAYPCGFTLRGLDGSGLEVDSEPASASPAAPSMLEPSETNAFACARQDTQTRVRPMRQGALRFASRINRRMHNKLFIADNSFAVLDGRNVADGYFMHSAQA